MKPSKFSECSEALLTVYSASKRKEIAADVCNESGDTTHGVWSIISPRFSISVTPHFVLFLLDLLLLTSAAPVQSNMQEHADDRTTKMHPWITWITIQVEADWSSSFTKTRCIQIHFDLTCCCFLLENSPAPCTHSPDDFFSRVCGNGKSAAALAETLTMFFASDCVKKLA